MNTIKWIIAAVLLGTMASCSEDGLDTIQEDCGCLQRTVTNVKYTMPDGSPYYVKAYGDWFPAGCVTPGVRNGREYKCL